MTNKEKGKPVLRLINKSHRTAVYQRILGGTRNLPPLQDPFMTHKIIKLKLTENLQQILMNNLRCRYWSLIKDPFSQAGLQFIHTLPDPFIHSHLLSIYYVQGLVLRIQRGIRHDTCLQGTQDLTK